ncbi:MAG TPA: hypothetical protein VFD58_26895 [Blastocatellia bacterium]|nr:hypothetical protein [Blastocatellia bacterium]
MITETNTAQYDREALDRLCAEIEIAWEDRRDDTAVDRLAAQHPEYARPLYDFFSLLVALELDEQPVKVESNVRSFLEYLCQRTGEKPTAIATKMKVPYPFLLMVQRHPQNVPEAARAEIADRAVKAWGVDRQQALRTLEHPFQQAIAASRDKPYSADAPDYAEMVKKSKMNKKEQEYWLSFAG